MSAEFWENLTAYRENLHEALEELQEKTLEDGDYYQGESKEDKIKSLEKITESFDSFCLYLPMELPEDTLYSVFRGYQDQLRDLKNLPDPKSTRERINEIIFLNEGEGTKSVLDFVGFSDTPEMYKITPLQKDKIVELFGTEKPNRGDILAAKDKISNLCDRLIGICFTVYDLEKPSEIYFAGYSAD